MKVTDQTVEVRNLKDASGKEIVPYPSKAYKRTEYETVEDLLTALQDPTTAEKIITAANYGLDLKVRANLRNQIMSELGGPGNAIEKLVKDILAMRLKAGKPITEEKARAMALAMNESE